MNKSQNNNITIDNQLANFTDDILNKQTVNIDEPPFDSDSELRALEQTALRLKNAFQEDEPSETVIQRMRENVIAQWQREKIKESQSFWKNLMPSRQEWRSQYSRRRWSIAISFALLITLMLISILLSNEINLVQPAANGQNLGTGFLVVLVGGLVLLTVWFFRRKR